MRIQHILATSTACLLATTASASDGVCDPQEEADGLCFVSPSGYVIEAVTGPNGEFPVVDSQGDSHFDYLITGPGANGGSCSGVHAISHADISVPTCVDIIASNPPISILSGGSGDPSCGFGVGDLENDVVKWDVGVNCDGTATFGIVVAGQVSAEPTEFLLKARGACDVATILGPDCGPTRYCDANDNSTGQSGRIDYDGSPSISANMFYLTADGLPPDQPGWFFMGTEQEQVPFGNGFQCLSGDISRLQKIAIEVTGDTDFHVDFTVFPMSQITAGVPWYFQLYYRDPAGGGAGYNTTDALCVTFTP